jgi:hypothetical protein
MKESPLVSAACEIEGFSYVELTKVGKKGFTLLKCIFVFDSVSYPGIGTHI